MLKSSLSFFFSFFLVISLGLFVCACVSVPVWEDESFKPLIKCNCPANVSVCGRMGSVFVCVCWMDGRVRVGVQNVILI